MRIKGPVLEGVQSEDRKCQKKKRNWILILLTIILMIGWHIPLSAQNTYVYPIKLSKYNRYLTDQKNRPFFWLGDAAWSLIAQLSRTDVNYYLDNRAQKGFTVILVNLIEHKFSDNAPSNYYNQRPFLGKPFITPNKKYFSEADYVIRAAAQRGIIVLLCPLYLGWDFGDEGWGKEVKEASKSDLYKWGQFVGNRYSAYDNIVWCIGGDTDPSIERDKIMACVKGISDKDKRHLFTAHNNQDEFAISPWEKEGWIDINNVYSYSKTLYEWYRKAYDKVPLMPYFLIESVYENEHNVMPQYLRSELYQSLLCGGMGGVFGNCPVWNFGSNAEKFCALTDWKPELDHPGSINMNYMQRLFRSRPWFLLVPDFNHQVMIKGYGQWGSEHYVTTAYASNGATIISYLPVQSRVMIDVQKISDREAVCWWYNPRSGDAAKIGTFPTSGSLEFIPPSVGDWVLVIDGASRGFAPPGQDRRF